ncbi:MAG TPA: radical SAM protein [Planctomycetota bacterium]|nr:radical SAM protein [Planctomycetota bacterium]
MRRRDEVDRLIDGIGLVPAGKQRRVAAVLFTYRCTIACKHCLFGCSGGRPDVVMAPRQCADALALLHETGRVVHIAGGEAMLYWDALREAVAIAAAEGNAPHFIETNCSFATDDAVVRERLGFLAAHGVKGLLASSDPFHQAFVPAERFLRVRRIAWNVFGERNFWGTNAPDAEIRENEAIALDALRLREYVRRAPPAMVGSACHELAGCLDAFAPDDPRLPVWGWQGPRANSGCVDQFSVPSLWELHVDPYGNIQTNCGIILGHVPETTPARLLAAGPERANRFVEVVCREGALGLAKLACRDYGFVMPERVTQTCHLCYLARRFLRKHYPDVFGPGEVYAAGVMEC